MRWYQWMLFVIGYALGSVGGSILGAYIVDTGRYWLLLVFLVAIVGLFELSYRVYRKL